MSDARIHVIHENDAWVVPLRTALEARGAPYVEWFLDQGVLDLAVAPPEGVFYNRMSASSHSRGHRYAPEYTAAVLAWLESHGRRVVNGSRALTLELSKVAQYRALAGHGIATPRTLAAVGREAVVEAGRRLPPPFITKHNRAGKGLGVRLFQNPDGLAAHVGSAAFEPSVDGITLVQEYIAAPFITRMEFVGGRFLYAVRVDTGAGFELCPADVCRVDDAPPPFTVVEGFDHPLIGPVERFLAANGIEIAGVEFLIDAHGRAFVYDVNTNTNYNAEAEAAAGIPGRGMAAIAGFLCHELGRATGGRVGCGDRVAA